MYMADEDRKFKKGMTKLHPHTLLIEKMFTYQKLLNWLKVYDPVKHNDVRQVFTQFNSGFNFTRKIELHYSQE